MMTVRDIVSLETPLKKEAAPIAANNPGSIHAWLSSVWIPKIETNTKPTILPYKAPMYLQKKKRERILHWKCFTLCLFDDKLLFL